MKKILCVVLALAMIFGIAGCSSTTMTIGKVLNIDPNSPKGFWGAWKTDNYSCYEDDGNLNFDNNDWQTLSFGVNLPVKKTGNFYVYNGNDYKYIKNIDKKIDGQIEEIIKFKEGKDCTITFEIVDEELKCITFDSDDSRLECFENSYSK